MPDNMSDFRDTGGRDPVVSQRIVERLQRARASREARRTFIAERALEGWHLSPEEVRSFAVIASRPGNLLFLDGVYQPATLYYLLRSWVRHNRTDYEAQLAAVSHVPSAEGLLRADHTTRRTILQDMNQIADAWLAKRKKQ
jgi:hypothetical protein